MNGPAESSHPRSQPERPREPLGEEEIRGLLGDDPGNGPGPGPVDGRRRVLVVSRDEDEVGMLRGVLAGLELETAVVRNPFGALDQLRLRDHAGVISDFEIWARSGGLLFHRLASSGNRAPVVFICSSEEAAHKALQAGAAEVLRRPLKPAALALAARAFAGEAPRPPLARPPPAQAAGPPSVLPGGPQASELSWLRFFFEARQAMRQRDQARDRLSVLLDAYQREFGAGGCGVGISLEEGWWVLACPGLPALLSRIGAALEAGPAGREGPEEGGGPVWWTAAGRQAVFISWPPGPSSAVVPEKFTRELSILLSEAGSPAP